MTIRGLFALAIACTCAIARTPDQTLGALTLPNNARPAMVHAGAVFQAEAQQRGELRLVGESTQYPLAPDWEDVPGGGVRAVVAVPAEASTGVYTLEWTQGDEADRNARAVYVLESPAQPEPFSQQYTFACVAIPNADSNAAANAADMANAINGTQAQFAIAFVGAPEDRFRDVLTVLDLCAMPTIVVTDAPAPVCARWFGASTFSFQYGPDAFLVPAGGRAGLGDGLGPMAGKIERLRQDCKTARWAVGLFAAPSATMSMRNEITLFVDDTLHACIYGLVDGSAATTGSQGWAGWLDPPRIFAIAKSRPTVFIANRKNIALQKMEAPQP